MKFETVFNATVRPFEKMQISLKKYYQHLKFRAWLLRHEEKQREEIARLQKQLSTKRSILDNDPVWSGLANCPPETAIGIRWEYIQKWLAETKHWTEENREQIAIYLRQQTKRSKK